MVGVGARTDLHAARRVWGGFLSDIISFSTLGLTTASLRPRARARAHTHTHNRAKTWRDAFAMVRAYRQRRPAATQRRRRRPTRSGHRCRSARLAWLEPRSAPSLDSISGAPTGVTTLPLWPCGGKPSEGVCEREGERERTERERERERETRFRSSWLGLFPRCSSAADACKRHG